MTTRLRVGQTLQLPSRNCVVVISLRDTEVTCMFAPGSRHVGEIIFTVRWLQRFAVSLDDGR